MKGFFNHVLASMLGTFLVLIFIVIINIFVFVGLLSSSGVFSEENVKVSENTVLTLKFNNKIADQSSIRPDFSTMKIKKTLSLKEITNAIEKAKTDNRIKGIYLDFSVLNVGIASAEEIRTALKDFKTSGKFILAHSDFYTHKSYYLASVADKIYLTPGGGIQFTGLSAQLLFYKSLLDKLGIEPEIIRHGKFKSAVEPFMSDKISDANKEQTERFLSSIWNTILKGIHTRRNISVEDLNKYADELSVTGAKSAVKYGFVDGLKYEDQIIDELKNKTGLSATKKLNEVSLAEYINSDKDIDDILKTKPENIAIIYAEGEIVDGKGTDEQIGSETLAKAIRKARKDKSVKAIVLRINSPGGSALASEVIWRETVLAEQAKPLIVSMGDVAASGGYYIACSADTIVAEPTTITGSIGVFGLFFNAKDLLKNVGITINTVNTNTYSDMGNPGRKMSDYEHQKILQSIEEIYSTFITHVGEGRHLPTDSVDAVGQGRVWSGEDALNIGLVDVLGGLNTAVNLAAKKAHLTSYGIKYYPEKDKFSVMLEKVLSDTKTSLIKDELGKTYDYYEKLKQVKNISGIQTRIPYFIEIK
ncbi:MAG: signal peptide peptidase SppA [Bacteroidales bacterium]|nr:signal peptide peptidase SppA [Bacteroidales bacterium]